MRVRLRGAALVCSALALSVTAAWSAQSVRSGNKLTYEHARFDVLSPSCIRMQYAPGGFVDARTAVVTNRGMADDSFAVTEGDGWVRIATDKMAVKYTPSGDGRFTPESLVVSWKDGRGAREWLPGQKDDANLGGPFGSFNDIIEQTRPENPMPPFPDGMLSRNGYYLLNDSSTPVWDEKGEWIHPRTDKAAQDWYFFVYNADYSAFFKDYTKLAGKIPMIPRYTLGAWVTDLNFEYFGQKVNPGYLDSILNRFKKERIPLDILVLDFAWHPYGWGGSLDWSPIIPNPEKYLKKLHDSGIKVTVNDHPGSGLFYADSRVERAKKALGRDNADLHRVKDISQDWLLRIDRNDVGRDEKWFATDADESGWKKLPTACVWENAGFPKYDGLGWYRKWTQIPAEMEGGPIHLSLGGVDDEYDLYVNGRFVVHHGGPGNSTYDHMTDTDITAFVRKGEKNLICLRVLDWGNEGGFTRLPLTLSDAKIGSTSMMFNLADRKESDVYMGFHNEVLNQGVDFWWIDGEYARMDGLNSQMWTNEVYYDTQEKHTGQRSFIFSRYGGPGSHRYPGFFTGDCFSNWKTLASEVPYTLKAGNTLSPYVTHDIGGFIGPLKNEFELYARWVQFGALSPMLRLHSAHENPNEGNARLPWNYGQKGVDLCRKFFTLRYQLMPYMYTYTRHAYDNGYPLARPLYLAYPKVEAAYRFDEYLLGGSLLVAPITAPGVDGVATREIYFPAGTWIDYFTGERFAGGKTASYSCPLDRAPLFVRQGSIIPMQPKMQYSTQKPVDPLILDVYPGAPASFALYEDDGISLDYRNGRCAWTPLKLTEAGNGVRTISIGAASGRYKGQPTARGYQVNLHCDRKPARVSVDGKIVRETASGAQGWTWDAAGRVVVVRLSAGPITRARSVEVRN